MKWTNQQVILCYWQQQFHKYAKSIVKGAVTIEPENPEIDVVARECSFEHWEAHNNALQRTVSMLKIKCKHYALSDTANVRNFLDVNYFQTSDQA